MVSQQSQQQHDSGNVSGSAGARDGLDPATQRKPWNAFATPVIGKGVRWVSRATHHGGSAFPGKVIEKIDANFLARTLAQLPLGVVLVSGTNGKTTTTRMVATMLEQLGLKVFTNPTGSNFTRGVVSALLTEVSASGRLDADIAVLELDEAYAVHFVKQCHPRYALLLNVMRDQLDRFGEIDNTARLLGHVAEATRGTVVLNREDARIAGLAKLVSRDSHVDYFGLAPELRHYFPSDDDMTTTVETTSAVKSDGAEESEITDVAEVAEKNDQAAFASAADALPATVTLDAFGDHRATYSMNGRSFTTDVKLEGIYNLFNAAAALALVKAVQADARKLEHDPDFVSRYSAAFVDRLVTFCKATDSSEIAALADVTPAFGRGEVIDVNGTPVELLLVKNPMGFRLSLASVKPDGADTMIAINDEYADGRDMSWLWDVDFTSLRTSGVAMVSGVRAWDMALRLEYEDVRVDHVDTDLETAITQFVTTHPGVRKHVFCTYTSMLKIRAELSKITTVADAGVGSGE